jgi:hypothetical protein
MRAKNTTTAIAAGTDPSTRPNKDVTCTNTHRTCRTANRLDWTTLNHAHDLFRFLELCIRLDSFFCVSAPDIRFDGFSHILQKTTRHERQECIQQCIANRATHYRSLFESSLAFQTQLLVQNLPLRDSQSFILPTRPDLSFFIDRMTYENTRVSALEHTIRKKLTTGYWAIFCKGSASSQPWYHTEIRRIWLAANSPEVDRFPVDRVSTSAVGQVVPSNADVQNASRQIYPCVTTRQVSQSVIKNRWEGYLDKLERK